MALAYPRCDSYSVGTLPADHQPNHAGRHERVDAHARATLGNHNTMYTYGELDAYKRVCHGEDQRRDQARRPDPTGREAHERHTSSTPREGEKELVGLFSNVIRRIDYAYSDNPYS